MVTKTFCDHCGNTVGSTSYSRFTISKNGPVFVASPPYPYGVSVGQGVVQTVQPTTPTLLFDLCPHCEPVWLERIKRLTSASDPEKQTE
jgi:hypothetical protein